MITARQNTGEIAAGDFDLPPVGSSMVMEVYDNLNMVNGSELRVFYNSIGRGPPAANFVRFRSTESPQIPLVYELPPQEPPQSFEDYLREQRDLVRPRLERNIIYGAAISAGRFVPAYFSGMDTRTPEGLGFPGRLVLASSLSGWKKK